MVERKPVEEMTVDECKQEMTEIGKKFDAVGWDPGMLYNVPMVMSTQCNALGQLLVKKGIITQQEADEEYFRLFLSRWREHEEVHLPQVREQRAREQASQLVATEKMMRDILGGDNGKGPRS